MSRAGTGMIPFKLLEVRRQFGGRAFDLLDVGCGSHSPGMTRWWLADCRYHGLDITRDNGNDEHDWSCVEHFYLVDLATLAFDAIPDSGFDVILMSHVLEHVPNGDEVLRGLISKLRPGGLLYVEFPGRGSLHLPSMRGSLNFRDDPTHVRLYSHQEIAELLREQGMDVVRSGTRRDPRAIALLPLRIVKSMITEGYVPGGVFWDLLGFAEYVHAVKRSVGGKA